MNGALPPAEDRAVAAAPSSPSVSPVPASIPSADDFEGLSTAERLLTREQIEAISDLDSLVEFQDIVTAAAKAIEVDLEYRSDDNADDFWEHRARRALTAHYVCNGHLTRRIAYLRRGGKVPKQAGPDAKAARREAAAKLLTAQAESKRAKADSDREKTTRAMIAYADRQNLLAAFHRAAKAALDQPTFQRLNAAARAELELGMMAELTAQGTPTRSAETTGSVGEADGGPVAESDATNPLSPTPHQGNV